MAAMHLRMGRKRAWVVVGVVAAFAVTGAVASSAGTASLTGNTKLFAYVREPGEEHNGIWLKDANGALVTHLDPGTYDIDVDDESGLSSFHLKGPGVNIATKVEEIVRTSWTVTLTDGTYRYYCDFDTGMNGSFTVGSPALPAPTAPLPPQQQAGGKVKVVIAGTNDKSEVTDGSLAGKGTFKATGAITDKGVALGYRTVKGDPSSAAGALITLRFVTKGKKGAITYVVKIDTKAATSKWTIASGTRAYKGLHGKGTESENGSFTVSTLKGTVSR